jgi:hypothetical protein
LQAWIQLVAASGEMLNLLSENSLLVSFGSMTGETMQISSGDLIFKQATVKGFGQVWSIKKCQQSVKRHYLLSY